METNNIHPSSKYIILNGIRFDIDNYKEANEYRYNLSMNSSIKKVYKDIHYYDIDVLIEPIEIKKEIDMIFNVMVEQFEDKDNVMAGHAGPASISRALHAFLINEMCTHSSKM